MYDMRKPLKTKKKETPTSPLFENTENQEFSGTGI